MKKIKNQPRRMPLCIPQLKTQWISESCLFPALHSCMRAVTHYEFLHYHHLRHSCATWLATQVRWSTQWALARADFP